MLKATEVTPKNVKGVLPESCKGRTYLETMDGMTFTIEGAAVSYYNAKGEDGDELYTRDEKAILNRTGYALIQGGFYSSFKGYTAIEQLTSCAFDALNSEEVGVKEAMFEPVKVKIITVQEKMGKKEYPYQAFEPEE